MIKMICKAKDEIREQMQAMNNNTNMLKQHAQEAKDHFNKEIEILRKTKEFLEMKGTINQIKNSMKSITNRLDHLKDIK